MIQESVSLLGAFLAGVLSFISPCVLPIVPGYLSFMSGVNVAELKGDAAPAGMARRVGITSLFFVLGFSTVFVALGAAATFVVGAFLQEHKRTLGMVGGVIIILLGLHTAGILPIKWLLYEKRADVTKPIGLLGAYVVGLAFAFGWTPCIGPILGAILLYASQQETVGEGILLLSAYSAGLGIPFLISAFAVNAFFATFSRLKRHMLTIERVSGGLLVAVGLLLVTGQLTVLASFFSRMFPGLAKIG